MCILYFVFLYTVTRWSGPDGIEAHLPEILGQPAPMKRNRRFSMCDFVDVIPHIVSLSTMFENRYSLVAPQR